LSTPILRLGYRSRPRAAAGSLLLFLCASCSLSADALAADDLDQVLAGGEQANKTSAQSQQRIDKVVDETERLVTEYRSALSQIDSLRVYNAQLDKLVAAQEAEQASLREQIENVTVIGRQVTPLMLRMVDTLDTFIELDVPVRIEERRERVAKLRTLVDRADVTDAEKYRRIMEAYQIENEYGRTVEAYQGELVTAGQVRTVDFLSFGRVVLIYMTLDGDELGVWNQQTRSWDDLDGRHRNEVRKGMRMARKQMAPDLVRLPVPAPVEAR